ncbi:hypothetical protein TL16_g11436 [Triparma laevis f. inornata]|uniref:Uncharacterized protein n=2 Tax=Triparma laevis TaxID=1534972 RepID=A0A9W6ZY22_9STRA|nr:hypothetical protein TrLO_g10042 [Triparma laevis f. longispina]GMH89371.1 hypothetical protein TL16_g11436 [Triparma laevis f. inornata]
MSKPLSTLIVGCSGALGRAFPPSLPSLSSVISIDLKPPPPPRHPTISAHLPLPAKNEDFGGLLPSLDTVRGEGVIDAVINTGGGWNGGGFPGKSSSHDVFTNYLTSTSSMLNSNLLSATFACGLATRYLEEGGHLILTGAKASLDPKECAGFMPGYGLSKNGVTYLAELLRSTEPVFKVSIIHPRTIDTLMNREGMPDADFDEWAKCEDIAEQVVERLILGGEEGDFDIVTEGGVTRLERL